MTTRRQFFTCMLGLPMAAVAPTVALPERVKLTLVPMRYRACKWTPEELAAIRNFPIGWEVV